MKVWPGLLWWLRAVLCWAYGSLAHAQQAVELPSLDQRQGQALSLTAQWFRAPVRAGDSAPAMVLLHGCGGLWTRDRRRINPRFQEMATRLNAMGIHALALDSLTPRGETELCTQKVGTRAVTQKNRRLDALGALAWLAAQPDVDSRRLGMLGWSNGGSTVLAATNGKRSEVRGAGVRATVAVAFYPGCENDSRSGYEATAPLLILIGAEDDWTPPQPCKDLALASRSAPQAPVVEIETYPGAHHGFDGMVPLRLRKDVLDGVNPGAGVHVGGHAPSREASQQRVAGFIKQHWGLP